MGRTLFIVMLMMWTVLFAGQLLDLLGHRVDALTWVLLIGSVGGFVATLALNARERGKRNDN